MNFEVRVAVVGEAEGETLGSSICIPVIIVPIARLCSLSSSLSKIIVLRLGLICSV